MRIKKFIIACIQVIVIMVAVSACSGANTYSESEYQDLLNENRALRNEVRDLKDELEELRGSGDSLSDAPNVGSNWYTSTEIGDTIQFGGYYWIVLDKQEGKALIITKDIIALLPFDVSFTSDYRPMSWNDSSLRNWLNDYFYRSFSYEQQEAIVSQYLQDEDVIDSIFLLSVDELTRYATSNPSLMSAVLNIPENEGSSAMFRLLAAVIIHHLRCQ